MAIRLSFGAVNALSLAWSESRTAQRIRYPAESSIAALDGARRTARDADRDRNASRIIQGIAYQSASGAHRQIIQWVGSGNSAALLPIAGVDNPADESRSSRSRSIEPWHSLCRQNNAGGFEISAPKPAPPSDYTPLSGVARCA